MGATAAVPKRARRSLTVLFLVGISWAVTLPHATAQQRFEDDVECFESKPIEVDPMDWVCQSDGDGWVGIDTSSDFAGGFSGAFGGFVVLALLWSAVPLVIAASLASARGESVGVAVGLTLFLGWIGHAIVYFGQRQTRDVIEGLETVPNVADAEDRVGGLSLLRALGMFTYDESEQPRRRILDSL